MADNKKTQVKNIFDSIAQRYDFLNHLLSFGTDVYWRKKALKLTQLNENSIVLDVACGTGDFAIEAKKHEIKEIFGADFSFNMLKLFAEKDDRMKGKTIQMVAESLPIKTESVSNITVAFGVRNFYDIQKAFDNFFYSLKKGGKATILEFRMPSNKFFKFIYKTYFTRILPTLGGIISGDKEAYKYLPKSVEEFDEKIDLERLFKNSGFAKVESYNLTLGIVQVVIGIK